MLLVLHCYQVPDHSNVCEHPLEGFLWTVKTKCEYKLPVQFQKISCENIYTYLKVVLSVTCAERLFLFIPLSFLLRREPVSLDRPKPLLTRDNLD